MSAAPLVQPSCCCGGLIVPNVVGLSRSWSPKAVRGPLSPLDRITFRRAAEEALVRAGLCWGEGAVYRARLAADLLRPTQLRPSERERAT
jgi:hypothetical protein